MILINQRTDVSHDEHTVGAIHLTLETLQSFSSSPKVPRRFQANSKDGADHVLDTDDFVRVTVVIHIMDNPVDCISCIICHVFDCLQRALDFWVVFIAIAVECDSLGEALYTSGVGKTCPEDN